MALEQFNLEGQVAIQTGAGKGVGQGIARVLAEAGATVVGTARTASDITDEDFKLTFDWCVTNNSPLPIPDY